MPPPLPCPTTFPNCSFLQPPERGSIALLVSVTAHNKFPEVPLATRCTNRAGFRWNLCCSFASFGKFPPVSMLELYYIAEVWEISLQTEHRHGKFAFVCSLGQHTAFPAPTIFVYASCFLVEYSFSGCLCCCFFLTLVVLIC